MFALAVSVLAMTALKLHAQVLPVNFQLKIQQQDFSTFNNGVYNDKVKSTKITTYDMLTLLGGVYQSSYPLGFPAGSQLVLVNFHHFQVLDPNGYVLIDDTAPNLTYTDTYSETNYLYQGKQSTINGSQNYSYFYESTVHFNNPDPSGTSFKFSGNMLEKYSASAPNQSGQRSFQDSLSLTGYGSGNTDGSFFLLSGRITTPKVTWVE